jgi:hypothetical protein
MTTVSLTKDMANQLNKMYWVEHDMYQAASGDAIRSWICKTFNATVAKVNNSNSFEYLEFNDEKDASMFLLKVA